MRTLTSEVKGFSGTLDLPDFFTLAQCVAIESAIRESEKNKAAGTFSEYDVAILPALLACVSAWHIDNQPEQPTIDTYHGTPRKNSRIFLGWLFGEIVKLYFGESEIPNA